jgi:hypothetical protein
LPTSSIEVNNGSNWATFTITKENLQLSVKQSITIQDGSNFAKIKLDVQSKNEDADFDWINIPFLSNGAPTSYQDNINFADQSTQANISIVFMESQPPNTVQLSENSAFYELVINNMGDASVHLEFSVGFQQDNSLALENLVNQGIASFDYRKAIAAWNVSYVVVTDRLMFSRFADHQLFHLEYENPEVEIYKVELS